MIRFGPSGNSKSFYEQGYTSSVQMPAWLAGMGLNAYEYQCNKGVNISQEKAVELGREAARYDIFLSIHAPYYINLASKEEIKRYNSIRYIIDSMRAASWMGAKRVVIHPGSCTGMDREEALKIAIKTLESTLKEADKLGLGNINICPETMGKINQLGNLDEIIEMCSIDERLIPTVDFGHLHARGHGCLGQIEEFERILDKLEERLGKERLRYFHCHYSRVEYTTGGEKRHWNFDDTQFGPEFDLLAEVIYKRNLYPIVICESRDFMAEDAVKLKMIYERFTES